MSKYNISGTQFNSKKSVIEYVRENIHSKYPDHQVLSGEHLRFMVALLRHHPWSDQKIGVGVREMWIQPNENYPTRGFWLEREDGTKTDFSFYRCVSPPSPLRDFKEACRRAIAPFVIDFRQRFFRHQATATCPVLGKSIAIHSSHVDHAPPETFEKIVSDFIEARGVDVEKAPLMEHDDGKIGNWFVDDVFENDWINFHNERAKLRVISVEANLSSSRDGK